MDEKIQILRGSDRIRLRPAVIFGSDDLEGAERAVEMMLGIMAAESMDGYSEQLILTLHDDNSVEMEDFGRGIYLGDNWRIVFCELYAGSQHEFPGPPKLGFSLFEKNRHSPGSTHDHNRYDEMTLCAVQYATDYMDVRVRRDGYERRLHFSKGENVGGLKEFPYSGQPGTYIRFKLDSTVFTDLNIPNEYWIKQANRLALVSPGVRIKLRIGNDGSYQTNHYYPRGIADYLHIRETSYNLIPAFYSELKAKGQDRYNWPRYNATLRIGLTFTSSPSIQVYYHNEQELEFGGTHIDAIFEEIQNKIYWILDVEPTQDDLRRHLKLVVITQTNPDATRWTNGSRRAIENIVLKDMAKDALGDAFSKYIEEYRDVIINLFLGRRPPKGS